MDPVWGMTSTEEHIWVGTPDGLLRYDLAGGEPLRVSGAAGPGRGRIVSVISDEHRRVWALSENGVGRYREGAWSHPVGDVPELGELTSMSLTGERTVWVGGTKGVASNAGGRWKLWSSEEITTLTEAEDGVWVGTTAAGLWYLTEDGVVTKYLQGQELPCGSIRSVVNIDDELWALCRLSGGTTLAHFDGTRWEAWTAELSERVLDLARCRNRVVLLTDGDLWRVDRLGEDQELGGDDLPLLQLTAPIVAEPRQSKLSAKTGLTGLAKHHGRPRAEGVPFAEAPSTAREQWSESLERPALLHVKVPVYHGASLVSCDDRGVWIGTKGLGVTRIARSGEVTVYRTLDLIVTERDFSVVADSEQNAWFLSSDLRAGMLGDDYDAHFEPQEIERDATSGVQILAFGSRGLGAYALGRVRGTNVIRIYQHVRDSWVEMLERELLFNRDPADEEEEEESPRRQQSQQEEEPPPEPEPVAEFSFFEVDPEGRFWIGLLLAAEEGQQPVQRGVIVVDLEIEGFIWHNVEPRGPGAIRVPNQLSVVDFTTDGEAWLGGLNGIAVMQLDGETRRYTEANGLLGGIVNDLAIVEDVPWVATPEGLGRFQDGRWRFFIDNMPENVNVQSLAVDSRGELWAGGRRGAVHYDGDRWEVLDASHGLISSQIRSVHVDAHDRIWFITNAGISIMRREEP